MTKIFFNLSSAAILYLFVSSSNTLIAQLNSEIDKSLITGIVIDANTNQPISGVNIFIAGTHFGGSSDEKGSFIIEFNNLKRFELVASHVSYYPAIKTISIDQINNAVTFELVESVNTLNEVVIESSEKDQKKYLRIFEREYIGSTSASHKCNILNPWVLEFHYDKDLDNLTATSSDLIEIENKALGYKTSHLLVSFSFNQGRARYVSKVKFDELKSKNKITKRKWLRNRKDVYLGSLDHFIKSLIVGNLKDEGFKVSNISSINGAEQSDFDPNTSVINEGSHYKLTFNSILYIEYKGYVENGYQYYNESQSVMTSTSYQHEKITHEPQVSALEFSQGTNHLIILNNGLLDPTSVIQHGYWSWKRSADILPSNFELDD